MFKKVSALLTSLVLLSTLTACGATQTPAPPAPANNTAATPAPAPKETKKVSLVLDWYPNAVHSFVYAAIDQGYFKDAGLDVDVKMPANDPTDGIKLVGAGKETFAFYYMADTLIGRGEGIPIVSVAAVVRHPLNSIMVPTASGIKSPKDLEGKQLGYTGSPQDENLVKTMVKAAGGDPSKVKLINVGFDLIPAISTKKVDGIEGGYINHEKLLLEKQGMPITAFSPADYGVPNYYELILITSEQTAKNDPATVKAFWQALARGQAWVEKNPDAALKLLLAKQDKNFPLDEAVETQSLKVLLPLMTDKGVPFGAQKPEDWQKVGDWLVQQGRLKADVKPADAFISVQ